MEIWVWRIESAILTAIERVRGGGKGRGWLVTFESRWKRWQKYSPCPRSPICPRHGESILFRRTEAGWSCWNRSRSKLPASRMGNPLSLLLLKLENFRARFSPGLASERNRIIRVAFSWDRIEREVAIIIKRSPFDLFKCSRLVQSSKQNFELLSKCFRGSRFIARDRPR